MTREIFVGGFVLGVVFSSFFDLGNYFPLFFILAGGLFFLWDYFLGRKINKRFIHFCVLTLFAVGIGSFRYEIERDNFSNFDGVLGETISFLGTIDNEPEEKEKSLEFVVKTGDARVLVRTDLFVEYKYGNEINIVGKINKVENFSEDFDYVSYLAKDGIGFTVNRPLINFVSSGNGSFLKSKLLETKIYFLEKMRKMFPEPHSSLLVGLLIGSKESLGKEWLEKFRVVGLSHIIVLSGYNLTIIADSVIKVFSFLAMGGAGLLFGSIFIVLFVMMTGGGSATVRAMIMALVIMIARATGRTYSATSALILAGFFMIIHNPKILVFDISFQLSFLATLGLIFITPFIKKRALFLSEKYQFRELVATTLGAQIATAPLILYKMGTLSLVALPVNIMTIIFIPATMFFGFFSVIVGIVSEFLALPFIAMTWLLLSYELFVTEIFSSFPFASVSFLEGVIIFTLFSIGLTIFFGFREETSSDFMKIKIGEDDWEIMKM